MHQRSIATVVAGEYTVRMNAEETPAQTTPLLIFSDFVCPWCYIGLEEIEKLRQSYDLEIQYSPFLLDPTTPPEGKLRRQVTQPGDPPTPIEQRSSGLGITFARGRTWTSNSHLALEAAEFAAEHGRTMEFHRAMFKAYFEDLADIGDIEVIVGVAESCGLPAAELREALAGGQYRAEVDEGIQWAQEIGVTAVPTFVLGEKYGIVGAQELPAFEEVLQKKLGRSPKA